MCSLPSLTFGGEDIAVREVVGVGRQILELENMRVLVVDFLGVFIARAGGLTGRTSGQ